MENTADKLRHGTQFFGDMCAQAKLTNAQAREVFRSPLPIRQIARSYGLDPKAIRLIKKGKTYKSALGMQ
jgi:hypothetical protein